MKTTSHDNQKIEEQLTDQSRLADSYNLTDACSRDILMQLPLSIVVYKGPSFTVDMLNEKGLEMWGITRQKAINRPLFEILPELREQDIEKKLSKVYTTGEPQVVHELPAQYTRNGKTHESFFNFALNPVRDLNGTIIGITSIGTDVTGEVTARARIEESEKRYRELIYGSPVGIYTCDAEGYIEMYNETAVRIWGRKPEPGKDKWCGSWKIYNTDGTVLPHEECPTAIALKEGRNVTREIIVEHPDGTRYSVVPYPRLVYDSTGKITGAINTVIDITPQTVALKKIEESEKSLSKLAAIIQFSEDAIISKTLEGIITSWNPGATKIFGYSDIEMIGQPITKIIPEDRLNEEPDILRRIQNGEVIDHFETKRRTKDGRLIDISVTISPVRDRDGRIIGASKIARDIAQAKKAGELNSKLAAIIRYSQDAIVSKTLQGIVTSWNPGAEKLFGYTAEEMTGQPITKIIPKDRLDEEPEILRKIQHGEIVDHFETKRVAKDGKVIDISLTISPVKDNQGKIIGASKIARDITEAKKTEKILRESEEQFRQIADSMPQIVWTATPDGTLDYFNRQWYEFTGFEEDYSDLSWIRILHPDDVQISIDKYRHSIKSGEPYQVEYRFKDGNNPGSFRWFMGRANPVRDEQGNIVKWFGTFTEIDDAKRIQQELELGKQQREDFIKMASHELKTPITTIKGYLQLVLNAIKNETKEISPLLVRSSLLTMDKQVSRLTRLMSELLDLSRIEAGQLELNKESFSLNELVIEMVQDVLYTNDKFSVNIYHDFECTVYADRDRLGQVLTNLLTNAIKYSPHSDKIEVKIYRSEKCQVAVSIKDEGIGIAKKDQDKIFERYYRAEGKSEHTYPGFGVGLYIVGEIIQRHNGRIYVESEKGKGSTFTFTLPVEAENKK